jgi:hypothetical protein
MQSIATTGDVFRSLADVRPLVVSCDGGGSVVAVLVLSYRLKAHVCHDFLVCDSRLDDGTNVAALNRIDSTARASIRRPSRCYSTHFY